jgi:gas vesicle protein
MKLRKEKILLNVLLGAGFYLLDSLRDRVSDNVEDWGEKARHRYGDLRDRAKDVYSTASERFDRVNDAIRGDDHPFARATGAALLGVGVGIGIGMLFAPASGKETRDNLADQVRDRFSEKKPATGTFGS